VRRFGRVASVALCSRGPIWRRPLAIHEQSQVYRVLKNTMPLSGLRVMLVTPEQAAGEPVGLSPMRRVVTGMSTVLLDLNPSMEQLRANLEHRWRHQLASRYRATTSAWPGRITTGICRALYPHAHRCSQYFADPAR